MFNIMLQNYILLPKFVYIIYCIIYTNIFSLFFYCDTEEHYYKTEFSMPSLLTELIFYKESIQALALM